MFVFSDKMKAWSWKKNKKNKEAVYMRWSRVEWNRMEWGRIRVNTIIHGLECEYTWRLSNKKLNEIIKKKSNWIDKKSIEWNGISSWCGME